jgi:hypothetical protein
MTYGVVEKSKESVELYHRQSSDASKCFAMREVKEKQTGANMGCWE